MFLPKKKKKLSEIGDGMIICDYVGELPISQIITMIL